MQVHNVASQIVGRKIANFLAVPIRWPQGWWADGGIGRHGWWANVGMGKLILNVLVGALSKSEACFGDGSAQTLHVHGCTVARAARTIFGGVSGLRFLASFPDAFVRFVGGGAGPGSGAPAPSAGASGPGP